MRKINNKDLFYEMFRSNRFVASSTTIEQDVECLKNQAKNVYTFQRVEESPEQVQQRQVSYKKRVKNLIYLFFGLLGITVGTMYWAMIVSSIPYVKDSVWAKVSIIIPVVVSIVPLFLGFKEVCLEKRRFYIDNSTYQKYEIREMNNGKLVLVLFQNLDGTNPLARDMLAPKSPVPPFQYLYFLENISVSENDTQIVIDCDMFVKHINRVTPKSVIYFQISRVAKYYQIYIQKDTCPRKLLDFLGYRANDMSKDNIEQSQKNDVIAGENTYTCRSFKYTKKSLSLRSVVMVCLQIMLISMILAIAGIFAFAWRINQAMLLVSIGFVIMVIVAVSSRQGGVALQLIQYLRDENGDYYLVQFTKGMSCIEKGVKQNYVEEDIQKAQNTEAACYYVKRFKAGYKDWDPFVGGEAKVIFLKNLKLVRKGTYKSKYTYEQNGRKKRIKIKNCYEGLVEELSLR